MTISNVNLYFFSNRKAFNQFSRMK